MRRLFMVPAMLAAVALAGCAHTPRHEAGAAHEEATRPPPCCGGLSAILSWRGKISIADVLKGAGGPPSTSPPAHDRTSHVDGN